MLNRQLAIYALAMSGLGVAMVPEGAYGQSDTRLSRRRPEPRREPETQNLWHIPAVNFIHTEEPMSKRRKRRLRGKKEA